MALDVPPERIGGGRGPHPALLVGAFLVAVVGVAVVTGQAAPEPETAEAPSMALRVPSVAAASGDPESAVPPAAPALGLAEWSRLLPFRVTCNDLDQPACRRTIVSAFEALPDGLPTIRAVDVWPTLLCGADLDCPSSDLIGAIPYGSVVVRFVDRSPAAWINVVRRSPRDGGPSPTRMYAWIVRWVVRGGGPAVAPERVLSTASPGPPSGGMPGGVPSAAADVP